MNTKCKPNTNQRQFKGKPNIKTKCKPSAKQLQTKTKPNANQTQTKCEPEKQSRKQICDKNAKQKKTHKNTHTKKDPHNSKAMIRGKSNSKGIARQPGPSNPSFLFTFPRPFLRSSIFNRSRKKCSHTQWVCLFKNKKIKCGKVDRWFGRPLSRWLRQTPLPVALADPFPGGCRRPHLQQVKKTPFSGGCRRPGLR